MGLHGTHAPWCVTLAILLSGKKGVLRVCTEGDDVLLFGFDVTLGSYASLERHYFAARHCVKP